jgi:hypothetical protein
MRSRFYRFAAREADFFAAILFWGGLAICALDFVFMALALVAFALGGTWERSQSDGIIGVALLALSYLLHKAQPGGSPDE